MNTTEKEALREKPTQRLKEGEDSMILLKKRAIHFSRKIALVELVGWIPSTIKALLSFFEKAKKEAFKIKPSSFKS